MEKKVVHENIMEPKITYTESDAVHPRFHVPDEEETKEYQEQHYFYCPMCQIYMAPTDVGLRSHFKESRIYHKSYGNCDYCKGPAYIYTLNKEKHIFHNCRSS